MSLGTALFLFFIYFIFFVPNVQSNPDTGITNCSDLNIVGETYNLSNDIHNDQITDNCINISASNITFDCQGKYVFSIQNYSGVYSNSTNTTIKNCNITMGSGANTNSFGIYLNGASSSNSTLFNNSVFGDSYAGIYLSSSLSNNLTNNNISSDLSIGIYSYKSNNSILASNTATITSLWGIYFEYSSNNTLNSNAITSGTEAGIYFDYSSDNNLLTNNNVTSGTYVGIYLYSSSNNNLTSNNVTGGTYGITSQLSSNNTITSNLATGSSGGIYLAISSNHTITLNNATGIIVGNSKNNVLISNNATKSSGSGILVEQGSSNNTFISNIATGNLHGIHVESSSNNTFISNIATSNTSSGIYLAYSSNNNTLTNCISNNNFYGLYILNSNGTIVNNLTAKNNSLYGIFLVKGSFNNIITNSFIQLNNGSAFSLNNTGVAPQSNYFYNNYFNNSVALSNISTSSLNYFNTTKTAGTNIVGGSYLAGNYWAAPNGSGFSQTCTSSTDGICDTSYNFDGINYDYLPLTCTESWSCGEWRSCSGGVQTRDCTDANFCQTYKYKPTISQSCTSFTSSSLQGGGGGASVSESFKEIIPNKPVEMVINNPEMDLTSVVLNVNEAVENGTITIKSKTNNSNLKIRLPTGRIYQAFEVTTVGIANNKIVNSTFNFKINKTWPEENNISIHFKGDRYWLIENGIVGNIKLYRLPTGVADWTPLETSFSRQDDEYYYFHATSPGFSTFVIFFNKYDCLPNSARCSENKVQLCLGNATWLEIENCGKEKCNDGKCISGFLESEQFYFLLIFIVGATIFIVGVILRKSLKGKKLYKPYSNY